MVQQLKISEIADDKKMSKAIEENKLIVTIKRPLWEFNLYWKFMCRDKNDDKNKMNLPPPPSTPVTVFLIAGELLSLRLGNFLTFSLFLLAVLWEN